MPQPPRPQKPIIPAQPYSGPAPEPAHVIRLVNDGGATMMERPPETKTKETKEVLAQRVEFIAGPGETHDLTPRGEIVPSPLESEENLPASSAELVAPAEPPAAQPPEWQNEIQALRSQLQAQQDASDDLRFQLETLSALRDYGVAPAGPVPLPPGIDPAQAVTMADLGQILPNVLSFALRAGYGITPEVEAKVLQTYPQFAGLPEPARTDAINKAYQRLKAREQATVPPTPSQAPPQAPIVVRPAGPTVSAPEAGGGGSAGTTPEPSVVDKLLAIKAEYDAALKERDPRLRKVKMRAAADKWAQAQGKKTYGDLLQGSYTQTRS